MMATIPPEDIRTITINETSFTVDASYNTKWWGLVESGSWEPATFQAIDRLVDKGSTYIDVGAWIGGTVLYGAAKASRVIAFEPDPTALANLKNNLAVNPDLAAKIELVEGALGTFDGEAPLYNNSPGDSGSSLFSRFGYKKTVEQKKFADIKLTDGRRFLENLDMSKVSLIKIDIEGGEYDLIPHIADILATHRPSLHISFHPFNISPSNSETTNAYLQMSRSGALLDCLSGYEHIYVEKDGALAANGRQLILDQMREKAQFTMQRCSPTGISCSKLRLAP
mgnify:CR=1 FL=1|tara:strand:+ start:159 stop:1004 length:846 start_codon:yes stop_codon:yes gene_type:complete